MDLNHLTGPAPLKGIRYPKEREKPPFQTWDEIERSICAGALSKNAEKQMWQALFLTSEQVAAVLAHVASKPKKPDFVYPMLAFVAYTGARRSEMLRSRVEDFNLDAGTAVVREKKRDRTKEETFRHVDLAEPLVKTLREWFEHHHPGGPFAFCRFAGRPLSRQNAGKAFKDVLSKSKW